MMFSKPDLPKKESSLTHLCEEIFCPKKYALLLANAHYTLDVHCTAWMKGTLWTRNQGSGLMWGEEDSKSRQIGRIKPLFSPEAHLSSSLRRVYFAAGSIVALYWWREGSKVDRWRREDRPRGIGHAGGRGAFNCRGHRGGGGAGGDAAGGSNISDNSCAGTYRSRSALPATVKIPSCLGRRRSPTPWLFFFIFSHSVLTRLSLSGISAKQLPELTRQSIIYLYIYKTSLPSEQFWTSYFCLWIVPKVFTK